MEPGTGFPTGLGVEEFGRTAAGEAVHRITISGGGLTARIMTWGAVLQDLRLDGHEPPLTLGFVRFADYPLHSPYFGATVGRFANRVAGGRFALDGRTIQLDCNENSITHLHGGRAGTGTRLWQLGAYGADHAGFFLIDPDGQCGYPGSCRIEALFRLCAGGRLSVTYRSRTDRPTIANIAHHSYFDLDGAGDIGGHELKIEADHYLPVDGKLIPTGQVMAVAGSEFDFRQLRPIERQGAQGQVVYDHNFCVAGARGPVRPVALARSPRSGVTMEVHSGEPGIQFYAGHKISTPVAGLGGRRYGPHAGFCLESQGWPDSPNHADFPQAVLRPGETLVQHTDYVFWKS